MPEIKSSAEWIRIIEEDGWVYERTTGSHWHFLHPNKKGLVTIPHPKKEIKKGTAGNIKRQMKGLGPKNES